VTRPSCKDCARKHLGQALILLGEAQQGYPDHAELAMFHLAEAGDELVREYPGMAEVVRVHRKALEQGLNNDPTGASTPLPLMDLIAQVRQLSPHQVPVSAVTAPKPLPTAAPVIRPTISAPAAPKTGCGGCAERSRWIAQVGGWRAAEAAGNARSRVVILSPLGDFNPSYSVVSVVLDQARAAALLPNTDVILLVRQGADMTLLPALPSNVSVSGFMPAIYHQADGIDDRKVDMIYAWIVQVLDGLKSATIIAHDLVFLADFTNWAKAWHRIGDRPGFHIYHMTHSSVGPRIAPSEENPGIHWRTNVPAGQTMVTLNHHDLPHFYTYFNAGPEQFITLLNPRDARVFMGMTEHAATLTTKHDLLSADVVQIYPVSAPRFGAKNVSAVIDIFAHMHLQGLVVRLVLADAHANGKDAEAGRALLRNYAETKQLPAECLVFVSESLGKDYPQVLSYGLDQASIRSLFQVSNLFVFPSISEAGPLVLLEAAQSGCLLVLNESLACLTDYIEPKDALWAKFGSSKAPESAVNVPELVSAISRELEGSTAGRAKRAVMRRHCLESYARDMLAKMAFSVPHRVPIPG
jgi:hypothetical protein